MQLDYNGTSSGARTGLILGTMLMAYMLKDFAEQNQYDPHVEPPFGSYGAVIAMLGIIGGFIGGLLGKNCREAAPLQQENTESQRRLSRFSRG